MNGNVLDFSLGRLDSQSVQRLRDCDVRLASVVLVAAARYHAAVPNRRLRVTETTRTMARQRAMVEQGKSNTLNSHHLDGRAVDIAIIQRRVAGKEGAKEVALWELKEYKVLDHFMQAAARDIGLGDAVLWGGHWTTLRDGVHWQIMLPVIEFLRPL